jgi:hypothetical protein
VVRDVILRITGVVGMPHISFLDNAVVKQVQTAYLDVLKRSVAQKEL